MTAIEVRAVWELGALLGEGPVWLPDEQALRFVDIHGGRIHRFDPRTGTGSTVEVGGKPSFVVPVEAGGLLVGHGHTLRRFDEGRLGEPLLTLDMPANDRTNDATVDGDGRLWFGTMDQDELAPTGRLHVLERGTLHPTPCTAVITNGPAVTGDGRWLYHVDTLERTVWRVPLDNGRPTSTGEVFVRLGEADGYIDGVVLDSEDCLWAGLWDGWGVRRYAPDGSLLLHVAMPCARVTKIAFGGPDLRTAYATTARIGLSDTELADQPLAGALFAFEAPAPGRVLPKVRLS